MSFLAGLLVVAAIAGMLAMVRSEHPHPRHDFVLRMLTELGPGDVAEGAARAAEKPAA